MWNHGWLFYGERYFLSAKFRVDRKYIFGWKADLTVKFRAFVHVVLQLV